MERVVVTGLGAVTPLGNDWASTWEQAVQWQRQIKHNSDLNLNLSRVADDFNQSLTTKERRYRDRVTQIASCCTREALADSDFDQIRDRSNFGVFVGTTIGGVNTTVQEANKITKLANVMKVDIRTIIKALPNMIAANLAIDHQVHGPMNTYSAACASGAVALGEAYEKIRAGALPGIIVVGAEACLNDPVLVAFKKLGVLSQTADLDQASNPFAQDRDGFVIAEGGSTLILESLTHAKARQAPIYCELTGYGNYSDAFSVVAPTTAGMAQAMQQALASAQTSASEIAYVNAHGTATKANDQCEAQALATVFADSEAVHFSSTKAMFGHLLGASGALEAALCAQMLSQGLLLGQAGTKTSQVDPQLAFTDHLLWQNQELTRPIKLMSNSFAFGGSNISLILESYQPES
ncbi:beta-ketoacyl-[acyl-carrier-protein] synthase family protein [Lactobacillus sp. DCY120]|uniref:Beta-ketoacyl-[acyl-carrier-protein] synthase family protein n=1 Tax=Bombilactobacillus apium TaxID=2675299 RepID=A0A850R1T9_9LACO|nr:beta-ketoacyl-[acyl-carrier-protein] synthase family protein [Bombilactobacillus apium]NVY96320.1 beta-ketoacyl-[acyl-carrier-protein] synthase family protein [Bombilactobacillus apium]